MTMKMMVSEMMMMMMMMNPRNRHHAKDPNKYWGLLRSQ